MKKQLILLFIFLLSISPDYIWGQEKLQQIIVNPFFGDKLDRVEENYFNLFPDFTDFWEAVFYPNTDSSLYAKVEFWRNNTLIDTVFLYNNSPAGLRNIINQKVYADIKQDKVKELKFTAVTDSIFEGTVYSYGKRQISFIKKGFGVSNEENNDENYLQKFNYFHLNTITVDQTGSRISSIIGTIGFIAAGTIAVLITPKDNNSSPGFDWSAIEFIGDVLTFLKWGAIGGVAGYLIGIPIEYPVDYDIADPETENILSENTLLKK
jgi:hypothetical protein